MVEQYIRIGNYNRWTYHLNSVTSGLLHCIKHLILQITLDPYVLYSREANLKIIYLNHNLFTMHSLIESQWNL